MTRKALNTICLSESSTVRECIELIDRNKQGIALIVDEAGRLRGTVTDGDIRRSILLGRSLDDSTADVMWTSPLTVPEGTALNEIRDLMRTRHVRNVPVVDDTNRLVDLVNLSDVTAEIDDEQTAFIMAGGEGRRLRPLTETVPKPMLKVGDRPIIASIIDGFREAGIMNIYVSVNYKSDVIEDYLQRNFNHGLKITCLKEKMKLGTAGALKLLPDTPPKPFIVINGDIITKTNFRRLLEFHNEHRCVMTVAATQYVLEIPYGVLDLAGHYLLGVKEKPRQTLLCNAGIYVVNPEVLSYIPDDTRFDMTQLIQEVVRRGMPVTPFPIREYWIDIGQAQQLNKARSDMEKERNGKVLAE